MKENVSVFWFRCDLRLHDNAGLYMALENIAPVLPVFIFDTEILDKLPRNDVRVSFIHQSLQSMRKKLQQEAGSSIAIYHGKPLKIFKKITENYYSGVSANLLAAGLSPVAFPVPAAAGTGKSSNKGSIPNL